VQGDRGVAGVDGLEACWVGVSHGDERCARKFVEVTDEVWAPVACADDADAWCQGARILHVVVRETVGAVRA
jgi:hypothetical protein